MNRERVLARGMRFDAILPGQLRDYQLVFNKRSVKYSGAASANVMEKQGSSVEGLLFKLCDAAQIETMDPFEGFPLRYNRYTLPIMTNETLESAWVYTANEDYLQAGLKPATWYLRHLLKGEEFLSRQYFEQLTRIECLPDSDREPDREPE